MLSRITNNYLCIIVYLMMFGILLSCSKHSKLQKQMEGYWGFDLCIINGTDYAMKAFTSNSIVFHKDGNCSLPQFYQNGNFRGEEHAKWKLMDSIGQVFIVIEGANNILSNTYIIDFIYNEQNNLQRIYFENNNTKIKMTKALANWN